MNGRCVVCHLRRVETSGYKSVPAFRCRARISSQFVCKHRRYLQPPGIGQLLPPAANGLVLLHVRYKVRNRSGGDIFPPLCRTVPARTPCSQRARCSSQNPFCKGFECHLEYLSFQFLTFHGQFMHTHVQPVLIAFIRGKLGCSRLS